MPVPIVNIPGKIITLIGSSRFRPKFRELGYSLELQGNLILMMAFFAHADKISVSDEDREVLFMVDKARIEISDKVLVVNEGAPWCNVCSEYRTTIYGCSGAHHWEALMMPYIGNDTMREIEYAISIGKKLEYLHTPGEAYIL